MPLGLRFILDSAYQRGFFVADRQPLMGFLAQTFGGYDYAAVALIAVCLMIGYVKGRFVLAKSVNRIVGRIRGLPNPTHLRNIYSLPYFLLLASMILIAMSIKYLHVAIDIRGAVDVAIGSALINGSMLYFRQALQTDHL